MTIGERIVELREKHGLSRTALSRRSGVALSYLNEVERDQKSPTDVTIGKICNAFGITPAEFYAGEQDTASLPPDIWSLVSKKENHALLKVLQNMIDKGHPADAIKEGLEFLDRVKKVYDKPENKGKVAWVDKKPDEPDGYDESTKKEVANRLKEELNKGTKTPWKE